VTGCTGEPGQVCCDDRDVATIDGCDPIGLTCSSVNPSDPDGDGLSADQEAFLGTDPAKVDTDGDGVSDLDELRLGLDPLNPDSDGDGIPDGKDAVSCGRAGCVTWGTLTIDVGSSVESWTGTLWLKAPPPRLSFDKTI